MRTVESLLERLRLHDSAVCCGGEESGAGYMHQWVDRSSLGGGGLMGFWDFLRKRPPVVDVRPDRGANTASHVSSDVAPGANSRKPPATPRSSKPEPAPATDSVTKEEILKIQRAGDVIALAALVSHGQSEVREAAA